MAAKLKNIILIIDDEPDIANLTEKFLILGDFDTITCYNAKKAIKIIEESCDKIDLILLNIGMPGRSGYSILEKVKNNEKFNHIPVELYSTRYNFSYDTRYPLPPLSGKDLLNRIKKILNGEEVEGRVCPTRLRPIKKKIFKTYKEEDINNLAMQLNWHGNGTEQEPFIITTPDGLGKYFRITQSTLYLWFKECSFELICLRECQNIRFEKINFKRLIFEECTINRLKECKIFFLIIVDSQDNFFELCSIDSVYNARSNSNVFRNCQFPEEMVKIIKKGTFSNVGKYFLLLALVTGIAFFYFLFSSEFTLTLDNTMFIFGFGGAFVMFLPLFLIYFFKKVSTINYIIFDNNSEE